MNIAVGVQEINVMMKLTVILNIWVSVQNPNDEAWFNITVMYKA